jgi:hypothetical protein
VEWGTGQNGLARGVQLNVDMIARIISAKQHHYYDNVVEAWSDRRGDAGEYLNLVLDAHPHHVLFWRPMKDSRTSVLFAADGEAFTAALRDEAAAGTKLASVIHEENA